MRVLRWLCCGIVLILAACAEPVPNSDQACALEEQGRFNITFENSIPVVTVMLDGHPARLLLDTGSTHTVLGSEAAERLDVWKDGSARVQSNGVGGKTMAAAAIVNRLEFAGVGLPHRTVVVLPFQLRNSGAPDGLLGDDVLSQFDIDLDLRTGLGVLYRPRNCPRRPLPVAEEFNALPILPISPSGRLPVPVKLDGAPLRALIDTGASLNTVDRAVAEKLGVTPETLQKDREVKAHGVAAADASERVHRFGSLTIGEDVLTRPLLAVVDMPSIGAEMLVGETYLRQHRLWISHTSGRVYISKSRRTAEAAVPPVSAP